jgi:hypothetical protein
VEVTAEFARWARELRKLDRVSSRQVGAAVELLKQHGDWRGWYGKAIPRAEQLYAEHIEAMSNREQE